MGWVKASEVDVRSVPNRIVISIAQRSLRVLDKDQKAIYETNVAVGKPATPTPLGRFYVDIWLPNPGRPYGSFMLSIAGFSDVLRSFGGGRGQIAMHGWADTSVMGRNVSNGCIRMRNADISHVAELAPLGTPVEIIA
jgi:lipoprotein-anchoring transpeptidase ErfK/SrfK